MAISSATQEMEEEVLKKPPPIPTAPPIGRHVFAIKDAYTVEDRKAEVGSDDLPSSHLLQRVKDSDSDLPLPDRSHAWTPPQQWAAATVPQSGPQTPSPRRRHATLGSAAQLS